ncbi:efflux RND transporter periplasmic adaptor subunit [Phenylobacterium sp.]|uniref:efflux RND transporter periplasmic adaptor subunit n=5 Tax=Phenylobacterium sp. TaxID=1871053 RepID=UPI0025E9DDD2|nr:efflux RND transporter periplasmic adaptor subunit [Phenylobacterium sp.]MCA6226545.1 efflux RND transporter periplasmic adaptor subunit [Phenylobacterium sp.]MCA6251792.1 efflux RND transporter periplasmic adaptor subunit [Phenylobacterium sp.]MCA6270886.1 efflux RND transporter periplasmic adaptor subunit [Phenylobacterium sp.]MCA6305084.1 efflux RND transporter periplasmic adaptor subunit [Phenylobacterium sp.]MCA6312523.1 efflux RND transporter periplasmic adaptor subunit [Phenylobacter
MTSTTRPNWRRRAALILGGLVLLGLVGFAFRSCRSEPEAPPYRTGQVESGALVQTVSASGVVEAMVTVEVGSQISGQIQAIMVDFNDRVKAGQVLAELDPQTYQSRLRLGQADVAAGEAAVKQADAQAQQARQELARRKSLAAQGYYSPAALEAAEAQARTSAAALEAARARVQQSRASLRTTEVDLSRTRIVSPIDGVVVLRAIEPGQTVAASFQAPVLFRIARDFDRVKVKISVDEADIGGVKEGQVVTFSVDAFPDQMFEGIVTQVRKQPVTEQNVVAYTVMAEAANTGGRLLPGMTANADIVIQRRDGVLKVPVAALRWAPPAQVQAAPRGPPGTPIRNDSGPAYPGSVPVQKVVGQLGLDPKQKKAWSDIQADLRVQATAAAGAGADREAGRRAVAVAVDRGLGRLEATLTPAQKARLKVLRPLAFDVGPDPDGFVAGVVYRPGPEGPEPVVLRVGPSDGSMTEVRGALKAGEAVILGGGPKARMRVVVN